MNTSLLRSIGLTQSQARAYLELIKAGSLTPPQLALRTKESRTACYMSLAKLQEIGLAIEVSDAKKQTYTSASPSVLSDLLASKRKELSALEAAYRDELPQMLSYYYTHRGKPGIKFFEGKSGLSEIYKDHLRTGEPVLVLRTPADEEFGQVLYNYMDKRAALHITAETLGPALPGPMQWARENDERLKRVTYWLPPESYTAPVEISIYGNKVSLISFGEEAVGIIIESPQIASAMRQMYTIMKEAAVTMEDK